MRTQRKFIITLLLIVAVVLAFAARDSRMRAEIIYAKALEEPVMTIDGKAVTLEEIAFYVAYEEKTVQNQALIYDSENPNLYWNVYDNGAFIGEMAKQAVLEMAAHDIIFYELACTEDIVLTEEEETYYKNEAYDFCSDLEPEQLEALGVTEQVLYETMRQIAVANKYQNILCEVEGVAYEDYNFDGASYLTMKEAHEIVIHEDIWDRVDVGGVTLDNY